MNRPTTEAGERPGAPAEAGKGSGSPAEAGDKAGAPLRPVPRPPAPQEPSGGPGVAYVYALGRAGAALEATAAQLTGVRGGPLRTVTAGSLAALVSSVPADAFSEEGMKAQLGNLAELEEIARAHHAVVEAAGGGATVLPMRLATVYLDDARVRSMLDERGAEFDELLSLLEGHAEVGVKVYADARAAAGPPPPDAPDPAAPPVSPGRAYLQRRRAQRRTHRDAYRAAGAVAEEVRARAAALARDRVVHRPQQGELASGPGENIANEAYLVPADRIRDFQRAVSAAAEDVPGVRVEITGPWAPYSFATPPPVEGRSA
ncbi:GvpL/GvpF family gas vesicle protein [Streptomyces angustmyceticus]|uniref:GvpL/GvpF family gas vesicle protein n=1 Tax=Streptomyces angustmyceticus TaxID=285578 RepID=UPI0037F935CD